MGDNDFYTSDKKMMVFISEELNPFAARCIGKWFMRCETARKVKEEIQKRCEAEDRDMTFHEMLDSEKFFRECSNWWWGMSAINKLSIVTHGATFFGIAISNEQRRVSSYIKEHLGFCPITEKDKAIECGFIME